MKKITLISLLCIGLLAVSCNKQLNLYPLTAPSTATYWESASNLKLYVNQFYVGLPQHSDGGALGIYGVDNNSDNMLPNVVDTRLNGKVTVPSSGGDWDFTRIRAANVFFENYRQVPSVGFEQEIAHYYGEVNFFKAYYYFQLLQRFGDLPWISRTLEPDLGELQTLSQRVKRNVVADSIIACLDLAIANLRPKESTPALRINREIALLFKSRVCLYEGTWEKYHQGTPFGVEGANWQGYLEQAAATAKVLIDEGKYNLSPSYSALFNQTDQSANPEVLLWKKYDYQLGVYHDLTRTITNGGGSTGLTRGLVESYLCTDGKPISVSGLYQGDQSLSKLMQNRDKRLLSTNAFSGWPLQIRSGNDTVNRFTVPPIHLAGQEFRSTSGYQLYKGVDPYTDNRPQFVGEIACVIFRFGEAMLNYVEARAELGVITQGDIDLTINRLRERAGVAPLDIQSVSYDPNWDFPDLTPLINEVRRERRVELACEGFRLSDLMRWRAHHLIVGKRLKGLRYTDSDLEGAYKDANGNDLIQIGNNLFVDNEGYIDPYQTAMPGGFEFQPARDYLLPIPTNEITLSGGSLVQNPNW